MGYPSRADVPALLARYYNRVPDGVVNDRFYQIHLGPLRHLVRLPGMRSLVDGIVSKAFLGGASPASNIHSDFTTPEYSSHVSLTAKKWETCRGLGYSFGYHRNETAAHMLSVGELVRLFVDIVSKNGNLLLNVGPMADGSISDLQLQRLEGLGAWLAVNGEAVFGTRPWTSAEGETREGIGVRFTRKPDALFAIILAAPPGATVTLRGLRAGPETTVRMLGSEAPLAWRQASDGITGSIPAPPPATPALALKFTPLPTPCMVPQAVYAPPP